MKKSTKCFAAVFVAFLVLGFITGCNNNKNKITGLVFEETSYTLDMGKTADLMFFYTPLGVKQKKELGFGYRVKDNDIVSVHGADNSYIRVTAENYGTTLITIFHNDYTATCTVTVQGAAGKTVSEVKKLFEDYNYNNVMSLSYLIDPILGQIPYLNPYKDGGITSEYETMYVYFFKTEADAITALPYFVEKYNNTYTTVKRDGNNIYFGTKEAVKIYEITNSSTAYTTYNINRMYTKMTGMPDQNVPTTDPNYNTYKSLYGETIKLHDNKVEFSGTLTALLNSIAGYTKNGDNITFTDSTLSSVYSAALDGNKFNLIIGLSPDMGLVIEYITA